MCRLLEQERESSHLLLQRRQLSLQGAQLLRQVQQGGRQCSLLAKRGGRWLLGQRGQAALMQAGQHLQMLVTQPIFPAIMGMVVEGKLRLREPAAQRFGINAQAGDRLGQRDKGHRTLLSCEWATSTRASLTNSREFSQENLALAAAG